MNGSVHDITHTHSQYTRRHDTNTITQSLQNFTHTTHRPISQFSLTKKIDPFHNPRGGSKGHGENSFFFEIVLLRQSVWRWWSFGAKEAEVNGMKEAEAVSMIFFFFFKVILFLLSYGPNMENIYWLA